MEFLGPRIAGGDGAAARGDGLRLEEFAEAALC
jgi:hypothetical protein